MLWHRSLIDPPIGHHMSSMTCDHVQAPEIVLHSPSSAAISKASRRSWDSNSSFSESQVHRRERHSSEQNHPVVQPCKFCGQSTEQGWV